MRGALLSLLALLVLAVGCGDNLTGNPDAPPSDAPTDAPLSAAKELTAFSFTDAANTALSADVTATISGTSIAATVPFGTNVTALVATFTTTGASVAVEEGPQTSGTTANDFSSPVVYTVTAADGTTRDYTVTVTIATASAKELTSFRFDTAQNAQLATDVLATISGTSIAATVPFGTNVTALVATFTTTGARVEVAGVTQDSSVTANDFAGQVTYTVFAADATSQDYTVTVTVAPNSAKALTDFSFEAGDNSVLTSTVTATITGFDITATVPFGTSVTALVATFATTGDRVEVGGVTQESGVTANDFASQVTYTVFAADATSQDYTVTVTVAPNSAKAITDFSFEAADNAVLTSTVTATITGFDITATVPFGTSVDALVATFATTGARVEVAGVTQESGMTANDFASQVTYTVFADDATSQDYTVTVTSAPSTEKELTSFSFRTAENASLPADFAGTFSGTAIAVRVPTGTNVTNLIATFTTSGAGVTVGGVAQTSGSTSNDFSTPVTFTVAAQDGSDEDYTVTVTEEDYCGALAAPAGGTVSVTNDGFVPSTATYACDAGRLINPTGGEQRTCASPGTWTPAAPACDLAFMVVKVGDGSTPLGSAAAQVVIEERRITDGALGRTIALPTAQAGATNALTISGSAVTEAHLSLSNDGRFVTLGGYAAPPGTDPVIGAASSAVPRVAGRIAANGDVDTSTLLDTFSTENIRGVTSLDGSAFWAVGNNSGVRYVTLGSTGTTLPIASPPVASRAAHIIGGQLYTHTQTALSTIGTGAPTTTGETATTIATLTNVGAIAMVDLNPDVLGPDTLYVAADGGTTPAGVLNVRKFTFDGTVWAQVMAFQPTVTTSVNTNRIAAILDQGVVHLVVTTTATSNNRLLTFVDDGVNMTPAATDLPAAGASYVYRGIARSPFAL